eukprot:CAMPEP_0172408792 /NCGR_PEP_ID=MMETSP1061-20121228/76037_1 /TAXON_ID=37318 /ORGANISM="Pseudo-nitzschia pungens, Strain cf. pungens" /LENGTH=68 /DNA_ID=CAMNT_0013144935 /DNA_START=2016 /DNA_END=2222 /DNA_ORIENTATION=-
MARSKIDFHEQLNRQPTGLLAVDYTLGLQRVGTITIREMYESNAMYYMQSQETTTALRVTGGCSPYYE